MLKRKPSESPTTSGTLPKHVKLDTGDPNASEGLKTVGKSKKIEVDKASKLGAGYFSKVYAGVFNSEIVAVKRMDVDDVKTWQKEINVLRKTSHRNVMKILFHDTDDNFFYIVMEKCDFNLEKYIKNRVKGAVAFIETELDVMHQATSGLCYLHSNEIIHGDIKPSNFLVNETPNGHVVKLTDFGISKILRPDRTSTTAGSTKGTEGYRAQEILVQDKIRPKSDVFALGIVFYKMLVGVDSHPFAEDPLEIDINIRDGEDPDLSAIRVFYHARNLRDLIGNMIEHVIRRRRTSLEVKEFIENLQD